MINSYQQINNDCVALIHADKNAQAAWKLNRALLAISNDMKASSSWADMNMNLVANADPSLVIHRLCAVSIPFVSSSRKSNDVGRDLYAEGLDVLSKPLLGDEKAYMVPMEVLLPYNLAIALSRLEEFEKAVDLFNLALSFLNESMFYLTSETIRAAAYNRIGTCLLRQEKYSSAIVSYEASLDILKRRNDGKRPALLVAATLNCIGLCHLYGSQSGAIQAETLFSRSLGIRRVVAGCLRDTDSATIVYNLGRAKFVKKDYVGAFKMYWEAFLLRRQALGLDHQDVGAVLLKSAEASFHAGNLKVALQLYLEFLNLSKDGCYWYFEHVPALTKLAQVYHRLGDPRAALSTLNQALESAKTTFGNGHHKVAEVLRDISSLLYKFDRYDDAIKALQACLVIELKAASYSGEYEDSTTIMYNLSKMLCKANRFHEALEINREIVHIQSSGMMTKDRMLFVAGIWMHIGLIYSKLDSLDEAIDCYECALEIRIDQLGDSNSSVALILHMIGALHLKQGDFHLAAATADEYRSHIRTSDETGKAQLSDALCDLGQSQVANGEQVMALSTFKEALMIEHALIGPQRFSTPEILKEIGKIYLNREETEKALHCFAEAVDFCRSKTLILALQKVDVARLLSYIGNIYVMGGFTEEGRKSYAEAIATNRRCGREDDANLVCSDESSMIVTLLSSRSEYAAAA